MPREITKIVKDISFYTVGDVFAKGLSFIAIILYTAFLTKEQVGAYGYLITVFALLSCLINSGTDNAYSLYFFEFDKEELANLTSTIISYLLICSIVILTPAILNLEILSITFFGSDQYSMAICLGLTLIPIKLVSGLLNQALRNQFMIKQFTLFNFLSVSGALLLSYLLLRQSSKLESVFLAFLCVECIVISFKIYYLRDLFCFSLRYSILKKVITYGSPFIPFSIFFWVVSSADRVMIEHLGNLEMLGSYTVAASIAAVLNIAGTSISQAWSPRALKLYHENENQAKKVYADFLKILIIFLSLIIIISSLIGKELILLFFSLKYADSFSIMLILMMGLACSITSGITASGISLKKKTHYFIYISFAVAIINIIMNIYFIPLWGGRGAAIATCLSYLTMTLAYAIISQRLFPITYHKRIIFTASISILLSLFASRLPLELRIILLFVLIILTITFNKPLKKICTI